MPHPSVRSPRECGETPQHHLAIHRGAPTPVHTQIPRPEGPGPLTPLLLLGGTA
ncbi:hypothetical protein HNQ09_000381 [Deinococcus budaensis]|uniref:Uncharacterized protein n=1 Tax=Deinococcus budaensis TaxID=1665626 RepID=A0A7W8GCK5_9DEIO|nr:hypothetical protein [Deinococcus budaensis]